MCACARPSSQPSRALATKGGSPHRVRLNYGLNEGVRSGCVHVLVVRSCFGCVGCASAVLLPVKPVVTRWITSQRKTVCNSSLGSATVDVSGNLSKKAPTMTPEWRAGDPCDCGNFMPETRDRLIEIQRTKVVETRKDVRVQPRTSGLLLSQPCSYNIQVQHFLTHQTSKVEYLRSKP